MELNANAIAAANGGDDRRTMVTGGEYFIAFKGIAVQEISFAGFDQGMVGLRDDVIPTHMRDLDFGIGSIHQPYATVHPAKAGMDTMFFASLRHQLHANTDAKEGLAACPGRFLQRIDHARNGRERIHAMGKGANAGKDDPVCVAHGIGIGRDINIICARRLQGIADRLKIASAIINEGDRVRHILSPLTLSLTKGRFRMRRSSHGFVKLSLSGR
jgi:hypothetical protein